MTESVDSVLRRACSQPISARHVQCDGSASVESETRDFRPDSDRSVNSGLLLFLYSTHPGSITRF